MDFCIDKARVRSFTNSNFKINKIKVVRLNNDYAFKSITTRNKINE